MQSQQAAKQAAADRQAKAQARRDVRKHEPLTCCQPELEAHEQKLSPAELQQRRRENWGKSGIVSMRGLGLPELSDLGSDLGALREGASAQIGSMDVGHNHLTSLPGVHTRTLRCVGCWRQQLRAFALNMAERNCLLLCCNSKSHAERCANHGMRVDVFGHLRSLRRLTCSHNALVATAVPWHSIGQLAQLTHAAFDHNCFTDLPAAAFHSKTLRVLDLSCNEIGQLSDDVGQLAALEELIVSNNVLAALPDGLSARLSSCLVSLHSRA